MKRLALCAATAALTSLPVTALATCTIKLDSGKIVDVQELTFPAFTPAVFDPEVANGTVLYEAEGSASGEPGFATCQTTVGKREYAGVGNYNPTYQTYPTPISGIGYRLKGGINITKWWPQSDNYTGTRAPLGGGGSFTIQLVKTGPITAAGTLSGLVGTTTFPDQDNLIARKLLFTGGLPIKPSVPTCKITKTAIGVPLGFVTKLTLDNDGASPYKPFSIDLKCSGGTKGTSTKMHITLTDATKPGNRSGLLSLSSTGSSAAKGVAVEIRRSDDSVVSYGPDSSASSNPNQWFIGQFGNTDVSIPLKARYVKTQSTITSGEANAKATFTMSYQ